MNGDQFREAVSESRRRLAAHQRLEQAAAEAGAQAGQMVNAMISALAGMTAAVQNVQLGLSGIADALRSQCDAAGWEWGPDAFHHGPEDEGNDQGE